MVFLLQSRLALYGFCHRFVTQCKTNMIRNYSTLSDQEKKRLSSPSVAIGDPVFLSSEIWIPAKILPE
ncbi:MAG: hypothetical protein BA864_04560 [Desulfuromonadales bacterium C00003093]|nr:MAG: hypothetical protein BA864_04560 [Desulfuromonadales bacterium C00003093]